MFTSAENVSAIIMIMELKKIDHVSCSKNWTYTQLQWLGVLLVHLLVLYEP